MNKKFRNGLTAVLAVFLLIMLALSTALADGESLVKRQAKDPADDADKAEYYAVFEAEAGKTCTLYIPLQCTGTVTEISCVAAQGRFPATLSELGFPSGLTASAVGGDTAPIASLTDQNACFSLSVAMAAAPTAASYTVPMDVNYSVNGAPAPTLEVSATVKVKATSTPTPAPSTSPSVSPTATPAPAEEIITYESSSSGGSSGGGSSYRSKPKVIIEAYSFDTDKLYAGEQATLSVQLRNTSTREAVRNLEFKFSNEAGVVMPVSGGSNSVYVGELKKNTTATIRIPLAFAPDAEAKAQSLALEIVYEGTRNKQEFTEKSAITVPVYQRARVRTDQVQIYDEAWVGQTVSMSVQLFNMGKSTLYNCMAEVQGDGLSLEETYYGGNVASGGTMRADLTVQTAVAGSIAGTVRVTYEDVFGEQSETLLPFTLEVNEEAPMDIEADPAMAEIGAPEKSAAGLLRFWWVLALVLLGVLLVIALSLHKRRRARLLADDRPEETPEGDWENRPDDGGSGGNEA